MKRCRVKLTRQLKSYTTTPQKLRAAQAIANEVNKKLENGWTPLHETEDGRLYTQIADLRDKYLLAKKREGVRETTLVNYTSFTNLFVNWCEDTGRSRKHSGTFLRADAVHYMDSILEKGNGNTSYNNTLKALQCFFQWALDHCYCRENPFAGIKRLPKSKKRRILIDGNTRKRIADYFQREKPQMLLVSKLVYYSAIRPKEIENIQFKHINLKDHYILIDEDNAKNHHTRCATITKDVVEYIQNLMKGDKDPETYLLGTGKQMLPSPGKARRNYFTKCWDKMRIELGLPEEMQLYSLRDSGISDLLHAGIDQLTVQHHADHSSIAIQNIYTNHFDPNLNKTIYEKAPEF